MNARHGCLCLVAAGLLVGLAACSLSPTADAPRLRVGSLGPGDAVTIHDGGDDVSMDISSERGIGNAEIERLGGPPKSLTLNLRLKGLEELRMSWGNTQVAVYVASGSGEAREEVSLSGAEAVAIDDASPYWLPVRIAAAEPAIPLKDGFFIVTAPRAFLQVAPTSFSLSWIDFYR